MRLCHSSTRAAIVDLDGTMVERPGDFLVVLHTRSTTWVATPSSWLRVDHAFVLTHRGQGTETCCGVPWPMPGACPTTMPRCWPKCRRPGSTTKHYTRLNGQHSEVYPGVASGLQRLRDKGLALACLANKPTAFSRQLLERSLRHHFAHVFGGDAWCQLSLNLCPDPHSAGVGPAPPTRS